MAYLLQFLEKNLQERKKKNLVSEVIDLEPGKCQWWKFINLHCSLYFFFILANIYLNTHTHTHSTYSNLCMFMSVSMYRHVYMWMSLYKRMELLLVYILIRVKEFGKLLDLFLQKILHAEKLCLHWEITQSMMP